MSYVRTCQECMYVQIANPPSTYADDSWREIKCLKCKSPALDYGREEKTVVKIRHASEDFDLDTKPLRRVIEALQAYAAKYGDEAEFHMRVRWDGDTSSEIVYYTEEIPDEKARKENIANADRARRRQQYEELRKEFGEDHALDSSGKPA